MNSDSTDKQPEELISEIISFLKQERETYGEFAADAGSGSPEIPDRDSTADTENPSPNELDLNDRSDLQEAIDQCSTLAELHELCKAADVLKTDLEGTNLVFGVGNPNADLMLIGEAPGAEEDRQGEPFVGRAGKLLNKILEAIDFSRDKVYIANILKHRPPNNRNPKPEERQRSLPFLEKQIDLIDPKIILSLGKISAQTLLNSEETLGNMRGRFHTYRGKYELLATYHPAALLRHERWKRPTWEDVQMVRKRYDELGGQP